MVSLRTFPALMLCLAAHICLFSRAVAAESRETKLPVYECHRAGGPICIDGKMDEADWQNGSVLSFYIPVTGAEPMSKTEGRLLWDDRYLYVGFKAYDKDIWSYLETRDSPTCSEDVCEVFIKTDPSAYPYFNFEINALGTMYDVYHRHPGAGGSYQQRWAMWNCEGLKVAIGVEGTLNDWSDIDDYYVVEIAIPFSELPTLNGMIPGMEDTWLLQLARYDYSVYLPKGVELSASVPLPKADFHLTEEWQPMRFVK